MRPEPLTPIFGLSPLGGNCLEGSASGDVEGVTLVFDIRVNTYISHQAVEELDDRDLALLKQEQYNDEEEFRFRAGYTTDGTRS